MALALILGAIGSVPLIFFTPPFQVPDENWHFYRAYELSELQILSEVQDGVSGATLPDSLREIVEQSVHTDDEVLYPATPAPFSQTMQRASMPLDSSHRRFIPFPGSAYYSPLPYLPQALGIAAGRLFGFGPLGLLYMGRLFNCLTALGLLGFAVYAVPFAEEIILLVGLMPMSLYLYASQSPDAALIACALVFGALSLSAGTRGNWKACELVVAAVAAAIFCSVKPVYFPLLLAAAVPSLFQRGKFTSVIRSHAILLAIVLGTTVTWMLLARSSMTRPLGGGQPSDQMHSVLRHPTVFVHALANSLRFSRIIIYYCEAVGIFGWLTVPLRPFLTYGLQLAGFVILWILGTRTNLMFPLCRRFWLLALAVASVLLVQGAMFLLGTHVGLENIVGVQGRYFIPILAVAGVASIRTSPVSEHPILVWRGVAVVAAIILLEIAAMDATILNAFQVF